MRFKRSNYDDVNSKSESRTKTARDIAIACRASPILSFNATRLYLVVALRCFNVVLRPPPSLPFLLIEHSTTGGIHDLGVLTHGQGENEDENEEGREREGERGREGKREKRKKMTAS